MRNTLLALLVLFSLTACSQHTLDPKINMKPPKYVEELPPKEEDQNFALNGSLFGQGDNPLFSDRKAMRVNDIVTVLISETASASSTSAKSMKSSNNTALGAGVMTPGVNANLIRPTESIVNKVNALGNVGFASESSKNFSGSGSNTRDEKFSTTVTARVVKVLQNGHYFIVGNRELLIDGEKQIVQLSGVISPYDIDKNNQIESKYISDAKILFNTQGDLKRGTIQGWGTRVIEALWPF
jgi:flagellar L-ring protein precursor FlgH